ncbi:30S ribosomal protein S8 [Melioribacteraceae bacterium 4301-Me]|uniref:30S ribosomal protein S8 n=1 Tax=Pyranulibacter aquaticus TaxID=3163344 RepID=UPI003597F541
MNINDPIADFLTRIKNAVKAKKRYVDVPSSKMKVGLAEILRANNFIRDYNIIEDNKQNILRIHLKYVNGISSISGLKKISKPGLKQYSSKDKLPRVLNGLGIAVISTPKGLLTDKQARKENVGGEVICHIW